MARGAQAQAALERKALEMDKAGKAGTLKKGPPRSETTTAGGLKGPGREGPAWTGRGMADLQAPPSCCLTEASYLIALQTAP